MENTRPKYPHAIVIVTLVCNLKCKNCILDAPYYKKPSHPSLEYLKETTDRAFALGDYEIFEFNGGEPFLRKDFGLIWRHAYKYIDNADVFKTVTNGSFLVADELIEVWKTFGAKAYIIVDNYGDDLSPNAEKTYDKIRRNGIPCELRDMYSADKHHGGWADFSAPEKPLRDTTAAEIIYLKCGQAQKLKHCCNIIDGLLMPCHMQFKLNDRGIVPIKTTPEQYIDLFDDTETIERKREKMFNFTNIDAIRSLEACRYCPGLYDGINRLKPAVQLTGIELKKIIKT